MTPEQLRTLREEKGWSQEKLARKMGLRHKSQVCHLESGRTRIVGPRLTLLRWLLLGEKPDR